MKIQGHIDRIDHARIEGWAFIPELSDQRVVLTFHAGEARLGHCVADRFRQDLADAGLTDGCCAFVFDLPPFVSAEQLARLRIQLNECELFWQPPSLARQTPPAVARPRRGISRFGGLWIDADDWGEALAAKHRDGVLGDRLCARIFSFVRDGYLVIEGAVPPEQIDAVNAEIDRVWSHPPPGLLVETFEPDGALRVIPPDLAYRCGRTKMLDLFAYSPVIRRAIAAPETLEFLAAIFADTPKAFQGLTFWRGSQQAMHKDTAYVKVDTNPLALAATWLALEDVSAGTGELEYFVGSHRAPDFLFGGAHKWVEGHGGEHGAFLKSLHTDAATYRHTRASFLAKKGDVLIWHADLAHGGSEITKAGRTRKSLVTHFTPADDQPFYRRTSNRSPVSENGCVFVSQYADCLAEP